MEKYNKITVTDNMAVEFIKMGSLKWVLTMTKTKGFNMKKMILVIAALTAITATAYAQSCSCVTTDTNGNCISWVCN